MRDPTNLAAALVADDHELELAEANEYVAQLMDEQVVVPDLGVHVTGPEPIDGMLQQLAAAGPVQAEIVLSAVREALGALDSGGLTNEPARYRAIAQTLEALPAKVDLSRLFQVDMVKGASATLATRVASEVARTIAAVAAIWPRSERSSLDEWRREFAERWEGHEIPLATALDEESGISFRVNRPGRTRMARRFSPASRFRVPWRRIGGRGRPQRLISCAC